jgi:diaminopropionate ammonia-lyase
MNVMPLMLNPSASYRRALEPAQIELFGADGVVAARRYLDSCPRHRATPLVGLAELAMSLGVGGVLIKDEGQRFGLQSFKALGGAYAVIRLVHELAGQKLGRPVRLDEIFSAPVRVIARTVTVACATDGNHGRSVAAGASLLGCRAVIYVHESVSGPRVDAIRALGAHIVRVTGSYDDAVARSMEDCRINDWQLISDTSWEGYERIPNLVMQGYAVSADEALRQLEERKVQATHVLLQAGVGGFAAAVAAHFEARLGSRRPKIIVVEPDRAACVFRSVEAACRLRVPQGEPTVMSMLECFEPSLLALRILERCADAFLAIPDELSPSAMRALAFPRGEDPALVSGESGAAGLGGLFALMEQPAWRTQLQLTPYSQVLLFSTESATDAGAYERLVGVPPAAVTDARLQG